ncbi:MAG: formylglycine-generating enzyme family protein [Planctomycetaceae bacterium]|nr:formylglycine-generating enzyme family protein [Planctomycetaceae bacterium]
MKLKLIPAGEFLMGSPESELGHRGDELQHRVRITQPFYMQTTTVTQPQWMAVMGTGPWVGDDDVKHGSDFPATYVSHEDAVEFCHKLSELESGTYRLPTEAEWEYACRARSQTAYCFGDSADLLDQYAWFDENADSVGEWYAHRVGQKLPNSLGLYDMHGNVCEWCSDWYEEQYPSGEVSDPTGPSSGSARVWRGGGWRTHAKLCRSADRNGDLPSDRGDDGGFRVCLSPSGN